MLLKTFSVCLDFKVSHLEIPPPGLHYFIVTPSSSFFPRPPRSPKAQFVENNLSLGHSSRDYGIVERMDRTGILS